MIKLLMAEDEKLDREMLRSGIHWNQLGIELVGVADNGNTAWEIFRDQQPDIVLTDIKMPIMDGIALSNEIKKTYPETKLIFMSGYQDFEYAKAGIDFRIVEYLTKPINLEELSHLLARTVEGCVAEKSQKYEKERFRHQLAESLPLLKERFYKDWVHGVYPDEEIIREKALFLGIQLYLYTYIIVADMDNYADGTSSFNEYSKQLLDSRILNCISEIVPDPDRAFIFRNKEGQYVILLHDDEEQSSTFFTALSEKIKININMNAKMNVTLSMGGLANNAGLIPDHYKKALEALNYKFFYGQNHVIYYDAIAEPDLGTLPDKDLYFSKILSAVKAVDKDKVLQLIDELFHRLRENRRFSVVYVRNVCIELLSKALISLNDFNKNITEHFNDISVYERILTCDHLSVLSDYIKQAFDNIFSVISDTFRTKHARIIETIKKTVENRYSEEISVEEIAAEVYLSPSYATTLFKNETNETIIQYLTGIRIKKAMELLQDDTIKIYEVSQRVGYSNITYFSSLFKNHVGITPKEFRAKG